MEKTYTLPDGTKFIFEYDHNRMGIITLECMDTLMSLLKATAEQTEPQTEAIQISPRTDCSWR